MQRSLFSKSKTTEDIVKPQKYVDEIVLHNEDNNSVFRYIATSAKLIITQHSGEIIISSAMEHIKEKEIFITKTKPMLLFSEKKNLQELDKEERILIEKGWLTPVFLPATITVTGEQYDAWSENIFNNSTYNYNIKIDGANASCISENCLHLSFNKGISLKFPSQEANIKFAFNS